MLDPEFLMGLAAQYAKNSSCTRSRCGSVLVCGDQIISYGYNSPPLNQAVNRKCNCVEPSLKKPKSDRTCCVHAEWRAILQGYASGLDLSSAVLYFVRIDSQGRIQRSGHPYCTVCSRLALDVGIGFWALYHDDGVRKYGAVEYNDLSYNYDKILSSTT